MGMGQSLFTILSMMLLVTLATRINTNILSAQDTSQNSKFGLAAISLATSKIEEASRLFFDESSVDSALTTVATLTEVNLLGPEPDEISEDLYDDVDDYNGYQLIDSTQLSAVYKVKIAVTYLNEADLNKIGTAKSWHKQIKVSVSSPMMRDTINFASIFSYWTFR